MHQKHTNTYEPAEIQSLTLTEIKVALSIAQPMIQVNKFKASHY